MEGLSPERILKERDFYLSLLELGAQQEVEPLLSEALTLVIEVAGARLGYIELGQPPRGWSMARGCADDELDIVRDVISRGIIAESLASGELIQTPSALLDPRFSSRGSVREQQIEAVLCAPIGEQPIGVLYLQGAAGGGPFADDDVVLMEHFSRHLASLADRLLLRAEIESVVDPTSQWRDRLNAERLVGRSKPVAKLLHEIYQASLVGIDVLLAGPTGAGKTLVAQVIASNGTRAGKPFVELNCAAIPEALVESELFGAAKGAHSTATKEMIGKVAAAEGGTLFLDEVAELPMVAQAKLLQLLQSRSYYPLGSSRPRTADIRVIAASNVALSEAVEDKRFRADLMHRLTVFSINVPGLDERSEDIPLLAHAACEANARRHGLGELRLAADAVAALGRQRWPGHVRQLVHVVEAGVVRAFGEGAATVRTHHLFPDREAEPEAPAAETWHEATLRFQVEFLQGALEERDWNVAKTARELELARSHVYKLISQHRLQR